MSYCRARGLRGTERLPYRASWSGPVFERARRQGCAHEVEAQHQVLAPELESEAGSAALVPELAACAEVSPVRLNSAAGRRAVQDRGRPVRTRRAAVGDRDQAGL